MEQLRQTAHMPSRWLQSYSDFISANAGAVGQVEGALRSLTYVIPGRFNDGDSEIATESLNSGVQLLSLYHDALLSKATARQSSYSKQRYPQTIPRQPQQHQNPHTRYTRFYCSRSRTYRRTATTLQVVQYTELLVEMLARRRGDKTRWRVVVLLESIKALCRLILMRLTNSRPLLSPPLPEREIPPEEPLPMAPSSLDDKSSDPEGRSTTSSEHSDAGSEQWTMPRTSLTLPPLPSSSDISSYLLSKVLTADDIKPPKALMNRVSGFGEFAEILYILRPLIYAAAMSYWHQRQGEEKGKANWKPWLLGLSIEYGAQQIAKRDLDMRRPGGVARGLTQLEKEEMKRRSWNLGWWAMRGAFYENVTKVGIQGVVKRLKGKPVLDLLGTVVEDYEGLWDRYYMSTATM